MTGLEQHLLIFLSLIFANPGIAIIAVQKKPLAELSAKVKYYERHFDGTSLQTISKKSGAL